MAGLAVELADVEGFDADVQIVPGISAAGAAAARLGAPLMLDYACISHSDLLVLDARHSPHVRGQDPAGELLPLAGITHTRLTAPDLADPRHQFALGQRAVADYQAMSSLVARCSDCWKSRKPSIALPPGPRASQG